MQELEEQALPKTPLSAAHLLDEEIDTLRALIDKYDVKIAMLEEKQTSNQQATSVNKKGKRVPYGEVKLTSDGQEVLDFYQFRLETETETQLAMTLEA